MSSSNQTSNVTEESDLHSEQHLSHKTSTDEGTIISTKPVSMNAFFSIRDNIDTDSNQTEESDPHSRTRRPSKTSTDAGIIISTKPVALNVDPPFPHHSGAGSQ
jgi:hypothetical protein